jgi:hypothetical protein
VFLAATSRMIELLHNEVVTKGKFEALGGNIVTNIEESAAFVRE